MAYSGYLMKVGSYTIPFKYIQADSYVVQRAIQDLDPYTDANGITHRNSLEHVKYVCSFNTRALLTNESLEDLMSNIRKNYTEPKERKFSGTLYVPETNIYVTQDMYMVDPQITIYYADDKIIKYDPIKFEFIGY